MNCTSGTCDILVDTWYSADGLEMRQSVPYAVAYWYSGMPGYATPYRGQRIEPGESSPVAYTSTQYDLLGRVVRVVAPDGAETSTSYEIVTEQGALYLQTCVTDGKNNETCTLSDSCGRAVEVDAPEGPGVAYTYDDMDRMTSATMGNAVTSISYDFAGRKTGMDYADMGEWSYAYDALNALTEQTDARGCVTELEYDDAGRLTGKSYDLSGCNNVQATASVSNEYDGVLNWEPFDAWPATGWVKVGSVSVVAGELKLTGNGQWNANYAYHNASLKDGQAVRLRFKVDDANAVGLLMVERGSGTEYRSWRIALEGGYLKREYNQGGGSNKVNLMVLKANTWYVGVLGIDGSASSTASSSHAPRMRLVVWEEAAPDNWAQSLQSFASGWSYSDWKVSMQIVTAGDNLYVDSVNEYDDGAIGQRNLMTDGSGSTAWEYTPRGEVEKESKVITGSGTFVSKWGYHPDGSMRWMTYPGGNNSEVGEKITLKYLPQKALEYVYSDTNSYYYLQAATYDAAGRLDVRSLGATSLVVNPVLKINLDYYPWNQQGGRLKYLQSGVPSSITSLQYFEYDYDPVGNIDWIKDYKAGGTQTQTFNYDTIDRLKDAIASGGVGGTYAKEYYTYNATTGNLLTKAGITYTYGDSSHPHAVTSLSNGNSYTYDANGNQLTKVVPGVGTQTRKFDAENRLVEVTGTASANFVYDGDGNRVRGYAGGTTTVYIGAAFEWTGSTSTMKRYYHAGTVRIAVRVGSGTGTTGLSWLLGDHLGSTSLTVSVTAVKTGELRYKPYGETRYSYGSTPTTFKFTGQREQVEIGLYFYQARWFDSALGRFVSADSMVPQPGNPLAWDRYLYVLGNPLKYTDPSGHQICLDGDECITNGNVSPVAKLKALISKNYGIKMSNAGKRWDLKNLRLMAGSLWNIDRALVGNLKSLVEKGNWSFKLGEHVPAQGANTQYSGFTNTFRCSVTFYTMGDDLIRQMNIYHEFGHVLDSLPGLDNIFSNALKNLDHPSFIGENGYLNTEEAFFEERISDPNYGPLSVQSIQHGSMDPKEQWADIFANAVAWNINYKSEPGKNLFWFVVGELMRVVSP